MPDGCLIDNDGNPTNDPTQFIRDKQGALRSFGTHKGGGLAIMCEIMATAIAGGQGAAHHAVAKHGVMNSMLATVIDVAHLGDPAKIAKDIADTRAYIKSAKPAPGFAEVLVPGEPERRSAAKRSAQGIEVDTQSWSDICAAAAQIGISQGEIDQAAGANL